MGNDGGSIPGRKDLVKEKQREKKIDTNMVAKAKSNLCALSEQPLRKPLVACKLGNLYNKETILQFLLEKNIPIGYQHITALKDVKDANVQIKNEHKSSHITIICPISQVELNGFHKFVIIWKCGCVLSEKAIQEVKNIEGKCINCGVEYEKSDLVSLNQAKEEQEMNRTLIMEEKKKQRYAKRLKKMEKKCKNEERKGKNEESKLSIELLKKRKAEEMINDKDQKRQKLESNDNEKETLKKMMNDNIVYGSLFTKPDPNAVKKHTGDDFLSRSIHHGLR